MSVTQDLGAFRVPPKAEAPKSEEPPPVPKPAKERLDEALLNAKVKFLVELKDSSAADQELYQELQEQLLQEHPKHEPLLLERLRRLAGNAKKKGYHMVGICNRLDMGMCHVGSLTLIHSISVLPDAEQLMDHGTKLGA